MSLEPTAQPTPATAVQHVVEAVQRVASDRERSATYAAAAAAGKVGLDFDQIKQLVDRLIKDLDELPTAQEVGTVTGASLYESSVFAQALSDTVAAARNATHAMGLKVSDVADAVLKTIAELSEADAAARDALSGKQAELEGLIDDSPTPTTPAGTTAAVEDLATGASSATTMRGGNA